MPLEKPNTTANNLTTNRPLKPTLASNRAVKSPITPRLAVQPIQAGTPLSRRSAARSETGIAAKPTPKEGLSTPVKTFLNHNVTPRSSSRKSHIGSRASTPTGTPSGTPSDTRPASTIGAIEVVNGPGYGGQPAVVPHAVEANKSKSVVGGTTSCRIVPAARSPAIPGHVRQESELGIAESPMFFHASEAKTQEPTLDQKKTATFFYADGEKEETHTVRLRDVPSPSLSTLSSRSKFFHADGTEEKTENAPLPTPPVASVFIEPFAGAASAQRIPGPRSSSPVKDIHLSYRKGASQVMRPSIYRTSTTSILPEHPTTALPNSARRRSSSQSAGVRLSHAKTSSLSSIDTATPPKPYHTIGPGPLSPLTTKPLQKSATSSPATQAPETTKPPIPQPTDAPSATPALAPSNQPQSPSKLPSSNPPTLPQPNELAANARRERKVLDLEISNSSLLAINRQLEREVRKQKAELRRFRRLSRAGRLSGGSTVARSSTGGASYDEHDGSEGEFLARLSEEEILTDEDGDGDDGLSDSSSSSLASSTLSPSALADRDARHLAADERRLQLDLRKHRELLVDSQRMNQSLRRCLGWTEELIREGKRAVEWRVRVSEVRLGGRVLVGEEEEEDEQRELEARGDQEEEQEEEDADLHGTDGAMTLKVGEDGALLSAWRAPDEEGWEDKDSGVEVGCERMLGRDSDETP